MPTSKENKMKTRESNQIWQAIECLTSEINKLTEQIVSGREQNMSKSLMDELEKERQRRAGKVEGLKWVLFV